MWVCAKLLDKASKISPKCKINHALCQVVIHLEVLYSSVGTEYGIAVVKWSVKFIRACAINHCQFVSSLSDFKHYGN
jgi:hypothetical protein